jgi:hypothetical protein
MVVPKGAAPEPRALRPPDSNSRTAAARVGMREANLKSSPRKVRRQKGYETDGLVAPANTPKDTISKFVRWITRASPRFQIEARASRHLSIRYLRRRFRRLPSQAIRRTWSSDTRSEHQGGVTRTALKRPPLFVRNTDRMCWRIGDDVTPARVAASPSS